MSRKPTKAEIAAGIENLVDSEPYASDDEMLADFHERQAAAEQRGDE